MNREDSLYTEDWLKIARKDWQRIKRNLEDNDAEASGFYLQQALEKYLKAFLLKHDWKLKKIHALHDLLADAISYDQSLEAFRELCEKVSGYYFVDRYPLSFATSELTCKDVENDLKEAKKLVKTLFPEEDLNVKN